MAAFTLGGAGALLSGIGSLFGGRGSSGAKAAEARNLAAQKEFAQKGIRWRVADAKAAGLHPLYALGAAGAQHSPFLGGSQAPSGSFAAGALKGIGRSMMEYERQAKQLEVADKRLDLEAKRYRNAAIKAEIDSLNRIPAVSARAVEPGRVTGSLSEVTQDVQRGRPAVSVPAEVEQGGSSLVRRDRSVSRFNTPQNADELRQLEWLVNEALWMIDQFGELRDIRGPRQKGYRGDERKRFRVEDDFGPSP